MKKLVVQQRGRAVEVLDRVHDLLVAHQVGEPGEEQVRLVAQRPLERPAALGLEALELLRISIASASLITRTG
jgi:hypothetical protein